MASQYIIPYFYRGGINLDREFGMRRAADDKFHVRHSEIEIDKHSNIVIDNKKLNGTKGIFELLTRNNIQRSEVTSNDLKHTNKYRN
jgi:hypothetical protein